MDATNVISVIYRRLKQDQTSGVMKREIDELRSEKSGKLSLTAACVATSGDISSALCGYGTLTSGGVKFHLRTINVANGSGNCNFWLADGGTTAAAKKIRVRVSANSNYAVTDLKGVWFSGDCRIISSAANDLDITIGGILEMTDGPY